MARATLEDIKAAVLAKRPEVVTTDDDILLEDERLSVYLSDDFGHAWADVYLEGNTCLLHHDGAPLGKTIRSIQDADKVATEILTRLDELEAAIQYERNN